MGKTIRFGDLVRNYGRPEPVTLWTDPRHDPRMSKAIRENRVLTVHQEPTSKKKDFGEIGFHQIPFAAYFVFPRSLPKEKGTRVIGINYQLAEESEPIGKPVREIRSTHRKEPAKDKAVKAAKARESAVSKPAVLEKKARKPAKPKPQLNTYTAVVRRTAALETAIEVKAENEQRARELASQKLRHKRFNLSKAVLKDEIVSVR